MAGLVRIPRGLVSRLDGDLLPKIGAYQVDRGTIAIGVANSQQALDRGVAAKALPLEGIYDFPRARIRRSPILLKNQANLLLLL